MTKHLTLPTPLVYRWLAQFFLCPPTRTTLESYRTAQGQQFLTGLQSEPTLASIAGWLKREVNDEENLALLRAQIASAFSQAFDMGGPRSALPYASVYLSEKGLLFQKPTRDMVVLLGQLQMQLPEGVNEPADHLGVQLHVVAELIDREDRGLRVPISSSDFLDLHVLTWLPEFVQRCEKRSPQTPVPLFAQGALAFVQDTIKTAELCREPM